MGGGILQLVAYGAQDIYLTGNPQITFFKIVYRRHTNFSMESIEQTFNGSADFGKKVTCTVSRNGDLIHRTYLCVTLPNVVVPKSAAPSNGSVGFRWLNWLGHALIKYVELEIGGQRIDKHWAAWLHIWNELTQTAGHAAGYANMVGNTPDLTTVKWVASGASSDTTVNSSFNTLYIPLQFWFCRSPGLALPLIALQYHEVKFNLEFEALSNLYWAGTRIDSAPTGNQVVGDITTNLSLINSQSLSLSYASIYIDYIYLDTEERRKYAQVSHEYLVDQVQFTGDESTQNTNYKVKLNFNHPCKELVWVVQPLDNITDVQGGLVNPATAKFNTVPYGKQWFNFTDAYNDDAQEFSDLVHILAGAGGGTNAVAHSYSYHPSSYIKGYGSTDSVNVTTPAIEQNMSMEIKNTETGMNPVAWAKIQLNGHDRFTGRDGRYFNLVQPYQHHTNVPSMGINVYSFALLPEEHQPSGTCNMSRIDNATLQLTLTPNSVSYPTPAYTGAPTGSRNVNIKVFAVNYNVLRIMSGMGGLAYSN